MGYGPIVFCNCILHAWTIGAFSSGRYGPAKAASIRAETYKGGVEVAEASVLLQGNRDTTVPCFLLSVRRVFSTCEALSWILSTSPSNDRYEPHRSGHRGMFRLSQWPLCRLISILRLCYLCRKRQNGFTSVASRQRLISHLRRITQPGKHTLTQLIFRMR
jgi:hypothetical protein